MSKESIRAQKEIPTRWFEHRWTHYGVPIITAFLFSLNRDSVLIPTNHEMLTPHILAALALIVGAVGDDYTTRKMISTMNEADKTGIKHGYKELNPLLPKSPTIEQFTDVLAPHRILTIAYTGFGIMFPPIGLGVATARGVATLNNGRIRQRLERELELTQKRADKKIATSY